MPIPSIWLIPVILVASFVIRTIGYLIATYAYKISLDKSLLKSAFTMAAIEMGYLFVMTPVSFLLGVFGSALTLILMPLVMIKAGNRVYNVGSLNSALIFVLAFIASFIIGYPVAELLMSLIEG